MRCMCRGGTCPSRRTDVNCGRFYGHARSRCGGNRFDMVPYGQRAGHVPPLRETHRPPPPAGTRSVPPRGQQSDVCATRRKRGTWDRRRRIGRLTQQNGEGVAASLPRKERRTVWKTAFASLVTPQPQPPQVLEPHANRMRLTMSSATASRIEHQGHGSATAEKKGGRERRLPSPLPPLVGRRDPRTVLW